MPSIYEVLTGTHHILTVKPPETPLQRGFGDINSRSECFFDSLIPCDLCTLKPSIYRVSGFSLFKMGIKAFKRHSNGVALFTDLQEGNLVFDSLIPCSLASRKPHKYWVSGILYVSTYQKALKKALKALKMFRNTFNTVLLHVLSPWISPLPSCCRSNRTYALLKYPHA